MRLAIAILSAAGVVVFAQSPQTVRLIVQPLVRAEAATYSADGKLLVTSAVDEENEDVVITNVINTSSGRVVRSLEISSPAELCVAAGPVFDRQGRILLANGLGQVHTWDLNTGKADLATFPALGTLTAMAFAPDGSSLLVATSSPAGNTVRLLDAATLAERGRFTAAAGAGETIQYAEVGGDTVLLMVDVPGARETRKYQVWSLAGKQKVTALSAVAAHLSPDGLRLAQVQPDGAALVDPKTGAKLQSLDDDATPAAADQKSKTSRIGIAFSPNGRSVVRTGSQAGELVLFAPSRPPLHLQQERPPARPAATSADDQTEQDPAPVQRSSVRPVAISPNGRWIVGANEASALATWDSQTGKKWKTFRDLVPHRQRVMFAPNSPVLLIAVQANQARSRAAMWDMSLGRIKGFVRTAADASGGRSALLTPNADRLYFTTGDGQMRIRNRQTQRFLQPFRADAASFVVQAISADGETLVTLHRGNAGTAPLVKLWRKGGQPIFSLPVTEANPAGVALSPGGRRLMAGYHLWDLDQKKELWEVPVAPAPGGGKAGRIRRLFFLDESRAYFIVDGPKMMAHLWDLDARKELATYEMTTDVAIPSADRKQLYAENGGSVKVLDLLTGKQVREFGAANWTTNDLSLSADGKWLAAATSEGIRLWDVASGTLKATLVTFMDASWAVVDPLGRYDATDPEETWLHFAAGLETIEVSQLKQRFYTPGLLGRIIRGEELPNVSGALQQVSLFPEVSVKRPVDGKIEITLKNRGGGLGRVVVKVNGRELSEDARPPGMNPNAPTATFLVDLANATLDKDGRNNIQVVAYDAGKVVSSRGATVEYPTPPSAPDVKPRLFAIISGVSEYAGGGMNLGFAAKDAEDMAAALRKGATRFFGEENVFIQVLSTTGHAGTLRPTKANFEKVFDDVAQKAKSSDVLVVYFAGHGMAAKGVDMYYYLTQDARSADFLDDKDLRAVSTVSSEELKQWCMRIKTVRQVIALDTCAAGAANQQLLKLSEKRDLSPDQMRAMELFKDSVGSFILMGSAADSVSYEANKYGQGLVTYALLKGMKGPGLIEGQRLDVNEWFSFAQREVEDLARDIGGIQRPIVAAPNSVSFPIGMLNKEDMEAIKLASVKPQLLRIACVDNNEVDPLKLTALTREKLRNLAFLATRGAPAGTARPESEFVYLDGIIDDVPGAVIPKVRYLRDPGGAAQVNVTVTMIRDGAVLGTPLKLTAPADAEKARDQIVDAIVKAMKTVQ